MALFQVSVLKNYLRLQDAQVVDKAYKEFTSYFQHPEIQENIRKSKEEQFQATFLNELFVKILGYTLNPNPSYNLSTEFKNESNNRKADGAILKDGNAIGVIELKGTNTKHLEGIRQQAFDYKANQKHCVYVITSNFEKLRFYIQDATEFLEFDLFELNREDFGLLWLCLHKENILSGLPLKIKEASLGEEEEITKEFYKDYSLFKRELFRDLVQRNVERLKDGTPGYESHAHDPETEAEKQIKLNLFKKSQKLIDRFLFIFFAEDRGLLPPNAIVNILAEWNQLKDLDAEIPLYERFKQYFGYLNHGRPATETRPEIYAYNGGLFKPDELLDGLEIDDKLLYKHTSQLAKYDFESQVDVNILGHIFENSLNEIESVSAEIEGGEFDKQKSKRKKDGVFYTPKYITKYIVENTVGRLCEEKKSELGFREEEYFKGRKRRQKDTLEGLLKILDDYRDWLLQLTICDPACGSGAFLNQALDFLIKEHRYIDEMKAKLLGGSIILSDIENTILERNIYGVDINEESVEIAKLSLWLRTAQPSRKLNDLSGNIKCGNSLIDNEAVAGEKAFKWEEEFPEVFQKGGFDVVIGNPPYGAFIDKNSKVFYQERYRTFQGNFEIYFFFVELLARILRVTGQMGYITPDTWINIPQAQKLREFVLEHFFLNRIVTFSYSIFPDASVNAIIFNLSRSKEKNRSNYLCEIINVDEKKSGIPTISSEIKTADVKRWTKSADRQFQVWQTEEDIEIISKMENAPYKGVDCLDVCQGIVPYSTENLSKKDVMNRIFHSSEKLSELYGTWIQGRAINRYSINLSNSEYLKYGEWLHRSRKPRYFSGDRILIQEITGGHPPRISAARCSRTLYHDPGIISCLNVSSMDTKYLLALVNSKLISWYNLKTSPKGKRTTFPKVLIKDIRSIPIADHQNQQERLVSLVDSMEKMSLEFTNEREKLIKYFSSQFLFTSANKKLQLWHELEFGEFIKELNKAIKAGNKVRVKEGLSPVAELTKKDEFDWMELFEENKQKAVKLHQEIEKTDAEIDKMVYELYGLTEEEIGIVEDLI